MNSIQKETEQWYKSYYEKQGSNRNDLLTNPEVTFQYFGMEDSILNALRQVESLDRRTAKLLDVGCGNGTSLMRFLSFGFQPFNLYGVDLLQERIDEGKNRFPNLKLDCADARSMPFDAAEFDIVSESTMFVQLTDESVSKSISKEMLRVTKPGGHLLLIDWRYGKPGNRSYLAADTKRIRTLFDVGVQSDIICQFGGALVPPVGRPLSRFLPSMYFLTRAFFPFLAGQQATLLRKR